MSCYIVLGMHGSGTSITARVLRALGVDMGNNGNICEDAVVRNANDKLIGNWSEPKPAVKGDVLDELREHFRRRALRSPRWGFKDPRTCMTAKMLVPLIPGLPGGGCKVVVIHRKRDAIARSLAEREKKTLDWAHRLIRTYLRSRADHLEGAVGPRIDVLYDDLIDRTEDVVVEIARFCRADEGLVESAVALVDPEGRHHA